MKKSIIAILIIVGAYAGVADVFLPTTGVWNDMANWDAGGIPGTDVDVTVGSGRTATIQTGNAGAVRRTFVNGNGTLIVHGALDSLWAANGLAVGTAGGNGTVRVIGGTLNSVTARRDLMLGGTAAGNEGTFQVGNGSASGTAHFRDALITANSANISLVDLQSGTLDVGGSLSLGKTAGTVDSVRMVLGGTSTLNAVNLNVGVTADATSARLDVNGSGVTVSVGNLSMANGSQINFNLDDSGISTLTATKLWYETSVTVNVAGTENVQPGSYDLLVGTSGGTTNETLVFNISGFNYAYTTDVVKTIDGETLVYTLNVVPKPARTFEMGACEQQLGWTEGGDLNKQLEHLDAMAAANIWYIRLAVNQPLDKLIAHVKRCNELGIQVLLQLSGGWAELYPPGTERRPGNHGTGGVAWDSYRLSDLDLERSEQFFYEFFTLLQTNNASIAAFQIFNEINWNAFNGDLPLVDGGLWIDESTSWADPVFTQYREGILKTAQLTQIVSGLNDDFFDGQVKIITSGLVGYDRIDSNWVAGVQGALVSQALTLQLMHGSHPLQSNTTNYLQYVDGIGMHMYPDVVDINPETAVETALAEISSFLDPGLSVPGVGTTKPYWITETGYARSRFNYNETNRFEQLSYYYDALTRYDRPKSAIGAVFHYIFSASLDERHAIWENGQLLKSADIFQIPAFENTIWTNYLFDAWQVEHFGDQARNDLIAGSTADYDGDGIINLEEYATGGDPTDPADTGYALQMGTSAQVLYAARTNDAQTFIDLEWCNYLKDVPIWQTVSNIDVTSVGSLSGSAIQMFSLVETSPASNRFFRLRITQALDAYESLQDGGFESSFSDPDGNGYEYNPTGTPWTFSGGAGYSEASTAFTSGNSASPEGDQVLFLQMLGWTSQELILDAGTYTLSFYAAQRQNAGLQTQQVQIVLGDSTLGVFQPSSSGTYEFFETTFTTRSVRNAYTLQLKGLVFDEDATVFVDDLSIIKQ